MKKKLKVSVSKQPQTAGVVTCRNRSIRERFLSFLKEKGQGGFADYYWSSSELGDDPNYAWLQFFFSGHEHGYGRNGNYWVRPVRAF